MHVCAYLTKLPYQLPLRASAGARKCKCWESFQHIMAHALLGYNIKSSQIFSLATVLLNPYVCIISA